MERRVAGADLVVSVGVVEPHLYAGFSGGVKGVAIGCAGQETIAWTHRPAFISAPGVVLGRLDGNPFQPTLREIAARTTLRCAVNVVMNEEGDATAVRAGDPVGRPGVAGPGAQRRLAAPGGRSLRRRRRRRPRAQERQLLPGHAGGDLRRPRRPARLSPTAASSSSAPTCRTAPATARASATSSRSWRRRPSPADLIARGLREPLGPGGQRSFVVARVLERYRLAVVGAADPAFLEPLGVASFDSVDAALAAEDARLGRPARVLAVADAMATVVHAR